MSLSKYWVKEAILQKWNTFDMKYQKVRVIDPVFNPHYLMTHVIPLTASLVSITDLMQTASEICQRISSAAYLEYFFFSNGGKLA